MVGGSCIYTLKWYRYNSPMDAPLTNLIESDKPLALFIGRKRQIVRKPWRLELRCVLDDFSPEDGLPIVAHIQSETVRLFIDDKLFSTSRIAPHGRYARRSMKITKPKRGMIEVHLTKKLTTFH